MKHLLAALALLASVAAASASKEGVLTFATLEARSAGLAGSGPVVVRARTNADGHCTSVEVDFGGRTLAAPADILAAIPRHANGVLLSFEAGYPETGGPTVYVQFQRGFTSHVAARAVLSVNRQGRFRILEQAGPR